MGKDLVQGVCIVFYEALCCKLFFDVFFEKKKKEVSNLAAVLILAVLFMVTATVTFYLNLQVIKGIAAILIVILFANWYYEGGRIVKIFVGLAFYGIITCMDYLMMVLAERFLGLSLLEQPVVETTVVLLEKSVLFVCVLGMNSFRGKKNTETRIKNSEWIILMGFPILTVFTIFFLVYSYKDENSAWGYLMIAFGMVAVNIVMFLLVQYLHEKETTLQQLLLLRESSKEKMQAFHQTNASNEYQKRILHDYKNQLTYISGLLQEGKFESAQNYTEKLTHSMNAGLNVVDVNHPVLNVILNQKYHLASESHVAIQFELNDLSDLSMEEQDLVILLSNIMDNAIEASRESEQRVIHVKMILEENIMTLSVKNTVKQAVEIQNNTIVTTKPDKENHGIGLQNVKQVIEKYDGMDMKRYSRGWFYYTALIPQA